MKNTNYSFVGFITLMTAFIMNICNLDYLVIILFGGYSLILIITGIFQKRKYYNKNLYLWITSFILVIILLFIIFLAFSLQSNEIIYIFALLFLLGIIWIVHDFISKMEIFLEELKSFDKILENSPDNTVTWNNRGVILAKHREYHEAKNCFEKVLKLDTEDAAALHNKGFVLNKLKKYKEALDYYDQALKLDPEFKIAKKAGKIILKK